MKRKIGTDLGRRVTAGEPVFGNRSHSTRLHRFTLCGRRKVDAKRGVCCVVRNIAKPAHNGYARSEAKAR